MEAEAHRLRILPWFALLLLLGGCGAATGDEVVRVASSTGIVDTGLLDTLAEAAVTEADVRMRIQAVGSGQAFALARRGEADVVLAHDPEQRRRFEAEGRAARVEVFAVNDFVLAGPPEDPAGTAGAPDLPEALRQIARAEAAFLSRADGSGTHARELLMWEAAGVRPEGEWYAATGQGMADTLRVADERGAYTITDTATMTLLADRFRLAVLVNSGGGRENRYEAIVVRRTDAAERLVDFLLHPDTQARIAGHGTAAFGAPLFRAVTEVDPVIAPLAPDETAAGVARVALRTLRVTGSAILLAVAIGVPLGVWLGAARRRRFALATVVNAGMGLPPVVAGLGVAYLLSRGGPLGVDLGCTVPAMIVAQIVIATPVVAGLTMAAVLALPSATHLQARALGARGPRLGLLLLGETRVGLLAAVIAAYGSIVSEVGAALMTGCNLRGTAGDTRLLTTAMVELVRRGSFGSAAALAAVLLGIVAVVFFVFTWAQRRAAAPRSVGWERRGD